MKTISSLAIALVLISGALALSGFMTAQKKEGHGRYDFGPYAIEITQQFVERSGCKATLSVYRDGRRVRHRTYLLNAAGDLAGLYVPKVHPPGHFAIVKLGDYDGRLFLIGANERWYAMPGGSFLITPDRRYLITEHHSDVPSVVIFDLLNRKAVLHQEIPPGSPPTVWYREPSGTYLAIVGESFLRWDPRSGGLQAVDRQKPPATGKLPYAFEVYEHADCPRIP